MMRFATINPIPRRGLSLLELLLAMSITAMVAAAITAMLGAVTTGVGTRRDSRTAMLLANAAQSRLSAYVAPSRCVLANQGGDLVLWLEDARAGDTVHATEIRWLRFDVGAGDIAVWYVNFPAGWSQTACDLEDDVYPMGTNWMSVLADYQARGYIAVQPLVDSLTNVSITLDQAQAMDARLVLYRLDFEAEETALPVTVAATIRQHDQPIK
jgi:prepilin-type N-terminal cleavage/methylation domain-containing protein